MTDSPEIGQPGIDSPEYAKTLHSEVAKSASEITETVVVPADVVPVENQHPLPAAENRPNNVLDFSVVADRIKLEKGGGGDEPSKTFLKKVLARIRGQHPNQEVKAA